MQSHCLPEAPGPAALFSGDAGKSCTSNSARTETLSVRSAGSQLPPEHQTLRTNITDHNAICDRRLNMVLFHAASRCQCLAEAS